MGDLLNRAVSPEIMNAAWRKLRGDNAVWRSGMSRSGMERDLAYHLLNLHDELRSGRYLPDPVRFFPVNKGDGKQRIISALTLRDKMAQRAVLSALEPIGEKLFHHDSFAYRPGRTIDMALSRVREYMLCGLTWVVDGDIESYFDNIPHGTLVKTLKMHIPDREVVSLIKRWLDAGVVKKGFMSAARGIPQGAVLSPFLGNLYLTSWDNDLTAHNLPFVRFADDFLVFAKSKDDAQRARAYVEKRLKRLGLSLNPQKTRVVACGPHVTFLGRKLPRLKTQSISLRPGKQKQ